MSDSTHACNVWAILCYSWGYDSTNRPMIRVVRRPHFGRNMRQHGKWGMRKIASKKATPCSVESHQLSPQLDCHVVQDLYLKEWHQSSDCFRCFLGKVPPQYHLLRFKRGMAPSKAGNYGTELSRVKWV